MNKSEIRVSRLYSIKVGKHETGIRIMKERADGGWDAISIATNKPIVIKSADRILGPYNPRGKTSPTSADDTTQTAGPNISTADQPASKMSGLDGAARVLAEAGVPLGSNEITKLMIEKGYWKSDGLTPSATIYSAMLREIKTKGDASRFRKAAPGKFIIAS